MSWHACLATFFFTPRDRGKLTITQPIHSIDFFMIEADWYQYYPHFTGMPTVPISYPPFPLHISPVCIHSSECALEWNECALKARHILHPLSFRSPASHRRVVAAGVLMSYTAGETLLSACRSVGLDV